MTITEFLRSRIDEDEKAAQSGLSCDEVHWRFDIYHPNGHPNPRAVAECAAKRAILAEHEPMDWHVNANKDNVAKGQPICGCCGDAEWQAVQYPCATVAALAAVYADHPDYQREWAIDTQA